MKALILEDDDLMAELLETVVAGRDSVLQAAHYGINGYMTKPLDVATLHERLGKLLKVDEATGVPDLETLLRRIGMETEESEREEGNGS